MLPLSFRMSTRSGFAMPTTWSSATMAACALRAHSTGVRRVKNCPAFENIRYTMPCLENRADRRRGEVQKPRGKYTQIKDRQRRKNERRSGNSGHRREAGHRLARGRHVHHDDDAEIEEDGDH